MQKLKMLGIAVVLAIAGVLAITPAASAYVGEPVIIAPGDTGDNSGGGTGGGTGGTGGSGGGGVGNPTGLAQQGLGNLGIGGGNTDLMGIITRVLQGLFGFIGIIAVIFVVIGGIQYTTSQGDSGKTKKAKDTIFYAVVGLIVTLMAYAIVNFVLGLL